MKYIKDMVRPESEFDCRKYVLPGDTVLVNTLKSADCRCDAVPMEAQCLETYKTHIVVRLNCIRESVRRWNIIKINGIPLGNCSGWFGSMAARA